MVYILDYNRERTVNCREKAGTEVVIKVLVLAHVIDLLPFCLCHLLLHQFWSHLVLIRVQTTILPTRSRPHSTSRLD